MKIVSKNRTNFIAVHEGMPMIFSRDALDRKLFVADSALCNKRNAIGRYINHDFEMLTIYWHDPFHRLLLERLEKRF